MTEHTDSSSSVDIPELSDDQAKSYANEWLNGLKRKAKVRLVLLVVLSLAALALGTGLGLTHQEQQRLTLETQNKSETITRLETQVSEQEGNNKQLSKQVAELKQAKHFLEQVKGDTASQLNIAQKIIETQKDKIDLIEGEYSTSTALVATLEGKLSAKDAKLHETRAELKKSKSAFTKRSNAYSALVKRHKETKEEVSRLVEVLEGKDQTLSALNAKVHSLEAQARELNQMLASAKGQLAQAHLASAEQNEAPSTDSDSSSTPASAEAEEEQSDSVMVQHSLAFQPIVEQAPTDAPITSSQSKSKVVSSEQLLIP